ncbi:MAG: hypothetical protein FJZ00_00015 [Candidatus Sericytochromatia bacterium]|uniref:SseB protein N-terminal domain-containing protein n=1 Tax=Candidatus Tanganyikabacteria bacterium TaxID=2961651 RepID=A0A937X381_9BACT|nr:hypothetical protein [Candidatus Tanganyikabacteria bacterium]
MLLDPKRPAFLVLEQSGNWATYDATESGAKALLVFSNPGSATTFFQAQGTGKASVIEILVRGVPQVVSLCQRSGVAEFVTDLLPDAGIVKGEPIADLKRFTRK